MIGPLFLHWKATAQIYAQFLSHVNNVLDFAMTQAKFAIGSDEELAILKAIEAVFPFACKFLCTKHLKDNCLR